LGGYAVQQDISTPDATGQRIRKITLGMAAPGRHYTYYNTRATTDGSWAFTAGSWLNGYPRHIFGWKLPPWPANTSKSPLDFELLKVSGPVAGASKVRARFGYAENGHPASFYCTSRQEACVTAINPGQPYMWLGEPGVQYPNCTSECAVSIPVLPGRVVYYVIDRLNGAGNVLSTSELQVARVP
jgi:hypothetical protein